MDKKEVISSVLIMGLGKVAPGPTRLIGSSVQFEPLKENKSSVSPC